MRRLLRRLLRRGLAVAPAVVLVAACGSTPESSSMTSLPDDATVTYAFHDASVPPAYHRSITLTVTRDASLIVVDSYGDVLADEQVPTPDAVWDALGSTVPDVASLTVAGPEEGCVGGTGIDLTVATPADTLVDLEPQFCGGSNEAVGAEITAWVAPARALFAPTDVLAPEGA